MTEDRIELRESGWSLPPDQHDTPPTQRKIGEGALADGPNGQSSTRMTQDGPAISRLERVDQPDEADATNDVAKRSA